MSSAAKSGSVKTGSDFFCARFFPILKIGAGIDVQMIDHPLVEDLAGMSDQQSYWAFDIPALMINDTSFIRNGNYHQSSNDIDTLSFDPMREVASYVYQAVAGF